MNKLLYVLLFVVLSCLPTGQVIAQPFYFGADLSYVNEMEDCGVRYKENGVGKDPYAIFAGNGANLVRLRLWHTPNWYDNLNAGNRYSDLADVKRSIRRAKDAGMAVLLDFHLSDTWSDPGRQILPEAWAPVVNNLPVLKDSLYNYIHQTLLELDADSLLPELVQIGNETNKGIMQSEAADAAGWALDWPRNAALFNEGIRAVRNVENETGANIKVAIHVAGPENAGWLFDGFGDYGVTDFDVIGLSYYWAWHQPTTIQRTGDIVAQLKADYPGKAVMIFETGYIWTTESNDQANNIISSVQPGYAPASPENQRRWLVDLTQEMINRGASGVIYWEPAWVSSTCRTQWGQGSHQEHATFFDFNNNLLPNGGMGYYSYDYQNTVSSHEAERAPFRVYVRPDHLALMLELDEKTAASGATIRLTDINGRTVLRQKIERGASLRETIELPALPVGSYVLTMKSRKGASGAQVVVLQQGV